MVMLYFVQRAFCVYNNVAKFFQKPPFGHICVGLWPPFRFRVQLRLQMRTVCILRPARLCRFGCVFGLGCSRIVILLFLSQETKEHFSSLTYHHSRVLRKIIILLSSAEVVGGVECSFGTLYPTLTFSSYLLFTFFNFLRFASETRFLCVVILAVMSLTSSMIFSTLYLSKMVRLLSLKESESSVPTPFFTN